ncbi:MAG: hypothetical protein JKX80_01130 [Candidatus Pacebacteria bacterium]|nr:hypothetical protein [Candidatus Paceibacterota bacterium]
MYFLSAAFFSAALVLGEILTFFFPWDVEALTPPVIINASVDYLVGTMFWILPIAGLILFILAFLHKDSS